MLCTTAINTIRTNRLSDRSLSSTALRLLPCDAMLARYMLTPCVRPSVRPSVCLSHVAVLLKGINLRLRNLFLHFLAQAASMQPTKLDISNLVCRLNVKSTAIIQGRPKSGPFLRVGNFATIQKVVLCGCGVGVRRLVFGRRLTLVGCRTGPSPSKLPGLHLLPPKKEDLTQLSALEQHTSGKKVKVVHTRLPSIGFRS